jgi:hypothetical protein
MTQDRRLARIIGILFIVASLSAIVGGTLVLPAEESDSVVALGSDEAAVVTGILVELLLVASVVGIASLLFPVLRRCSEGLALAYLGARLVEGILLLAAAVSAMVIVVLHRDLATSGTEGAAAWGEVLVATRQTTYQLGSLVAFGVSALILYWLLYRSRLVPVWLSVWGLAGGVLIVVRGVWELYGADLPGALQAALTAPVGINEMVLAVWLIFRGFAGTTAPATP